MAKGPLHIFFWPDRIDCQADSPILIFLVRNHLGIWNVWGTGTVVKPSRPVFISLFFFHISLPYAQGFFIYGKIRLYYRFVFFFRYQIRSPVHGLFIGNRNAVGTGIQLCKQIIEIQYFPLPFRPILQKHIIGSISYRKNIFAVPFPAFFIQRFHTDSRISLRSVISCRNFLSKKQITVLRIFPLPRRITFCIIHFRHPAFPMQNTPCHKNRSFLRLQVKTDKTSVIHNRENGLSPVLSFLCQPDPLLYQFRVCQIHLVLIFLVDRAIAVFPHSVHNRLCRLQASQRILLHRPLINIPVCFRCLSGFCLQVFLLSV